MLGVKQRGIKYHFFKKVFSMKVIIIIVIPITSLKDVTTVEDFNLTTVISLSSKNPILNIQIYILSLNIKSIIFVSLFNGISTFGRYPMLSI